MKPHKPKWIASINHYKIASRDAYNKEAGRVVVVARQADVRCPVIWELDGLQMLVECVHHARGKNCESLRHDKRAWFLFSLGGHDWSHRFPTESRKHGWICPLGKWGTPFKADEPPMPGSVADLEAKGVLK